MKKISKFKKFVIAIMCGVAGLAGAASVTGTYAWFVAANTVNISGMSIKAQAENGIVIANEDKNGDSKWLTTVTASHSGGDSEFVPTSTANCGTWYHGLSDEADNGQHNVVYDTFAAPTITDGVAAATSPNHFTTAHNIYLVNDFYVQASAQTAITGQDIFLEEVTITGASGSENLDKSIRVGLKIDDTFKAIYAPLSGATLNYMVNGATYESTYDVTAIDVSAANDKTKVCDTINIPAYDSNGASSIKFTFFVYFEGEDANHKSSNITNSLDTLALSFKLTNANHQA